MDPGAEPHRGHCNWQLEASVSVISSLFTVIVLTAGTYDLGDFFISWNATDSALSSPCSLVAQGVPEATEKGGEFLFQVGGWSGAVGVQLLWGIVLGGERRVSPDLYRRLDTMGIWKYGWGTCEKKMLEMNFRFAPEANRKSHQGMGFSACGASGWFGRVQSNLGTEPPHCRH